MTPHNVPLWDQIDDSAGPLECWPWTGQVNKNGYGICSQVMGERVAHRATFYAANLWWPTSHCKRTCSNRLCCNPLHIVDKSKNLYARTSQTESVAAQPHWVSMTSSELNMYLTRSFDPLWVRIENGAVQAFNSHTVAIDYRECIVCKLYMHGRNALTVRCINTSPPKESTNGRLVPGESFRGPR